jgi:four helix bundle protein
VENDLLRRTKAYALRIIKLVESLPNTPVCRTLGGQLLDAGTSVGANYRAACRPKSLADFIAKLGIVEEEADESLFWMELLIEAGIIKPELLGDLMKEGNEILAMVVSSIRTSKAKQIATKSAKQRPNPS